MNSTFHYYIVFGLAKEAGFSRRDAYEIALSSAYVDFNITPTNTGDLLIEPTQNYGYQDFPKKNIWEVFHYIPSLEIDLPYPLPSNELSKRLLISALKSKNLYRIGIALHAYADTWAHQNFIAGFDEHNILLKNSPLPAVGHAQAGFVPDIMGLSWKDPRTAELISNQTRYLEAARVIYKYLCVYTSKNISKPENDLRTFYEMSETLYNWENADLYGGSILGIAQNPKARLLMEARWTGHKDVKIIDILTEAYEIPKFPKKFENDDMLFAWARAAKEHRDDFCFLRQNIHK